MEDTAKTSALLQEAGGATKQVEPMDIVVLAGGPSSERDVSLASGKAVHEALGKIGHRVVIDDISPDNLAALDRQADFVFIALHGEFGEDGTLQAELDRRGIRYSGSGSRASALAMDKVKAKNRFAASGLPTPASFVANRENFRQVTDRMQAPAVVKPVSAGSSVDTTIVRDAASLAADTEAVVSKYGEALVETFIEGPELTCAILGDEPLPVCQIRPAREFYDYEAKYLVDDTSYIFEPALPASLLEEVQRLAVSAHTCLGCEVFSRVDVMIDSSHRPYLLEVNTIPGFTGHSLVPKAAARVGTDFEALCQRIVELSLHKHSQA